MGPKFLAMLHSSSFMTFFIMAQDLYSLGCYLDYFLFHLLNWVDSSRIKTQVSEFKI